MNVLCHGAPFCSDYTLLDLYRGRHDVRRLGIDESAQYRYDPVGESMNDILKRLGSAWQPELILCWTPEIYPPPMGIEESAIPTAALVSDWHVYYPVLSVNLARFDAVLCDRAGVDVFRSALVEPLYLFPLYSQVSSVHRSMSVAKDLDVVYVGSLSAAAHHRRAHYLERLARMAPRHRILIASGYFGEDYVRLLNRARIAFNHTLRGELNLRVFETLACGAVPFIEDDNHEVRDWFEDGVDVVLYNEKNLEERITHILQHPEEAESIRQKGLARAVEFAGENRLDALIDWVAARGRGARRFRELPPEERLYQDLLLLGFSRWPVYAPLGERMVNALARARPLDPRTWTAIGRHLIPAPEAASDRAAVERCIKAFARAGQLEPGSAPCALNMATFAGAYGLDHLEAQHLEAVLKGDSLEGAELILGHAGCPFWNRWSRAVAEGQASLAIVQAEAHVRLARLVARFGEPELAEDHLAQAAELDPDNNKGISLRAELQWATGRKNEAVRTLQNGLPELPLDFDCRGRLHRMLIDTGRDNEAAELAAETDMMRGRILIAAAD